MNGRSEHKTGPRKKQAPRRAKARSPSQTRFQLIVKGGATREEHDEIFRVWKKELSLGRRLKLRIPHASEAAAGKLTVTAPGSGPGIVIEMPDMMRLLSEQVVPKLPRSFAFHPDFREAEQRKGKWVLRTYGGDFPQVYVIRGPGFRAFTLKKTKQRGRPRGTGRRKRAPGSERALVEKLYLTSRASTLARWLQQHGLTQAQSEVLTRRLVDHQLQQEIAGERGVSVQAVSAILRRASDKLFQACKANPRLADHLMPYFGPQAETTKQPGD